MLVQVKTLQPGDYVDMTPLLKMLRDVGAQVDDAEILSAEFEYGIVDSVALETPICMRIDFENFNSYGVHPDYLVELGGRRRNPRLTRHGASR